LPQSALVALGWDEDFAASFAPYAVTGHLPARVARVDRGACDLLPGSGPTRASVDGGMLAAAAADPLAAPCTGDWAAVRVWPDGRATLAAVLPRRTAVVRAEASGTSRGQVLAANVDTVAVVLSLAAEPDLGRLERLLALAWESGARPVVVLTKSDLVSDAAVVRGEVVAAAPGAEVLTLSAVTGDGYAALAPYITAGRTLALVGTSGVGKSTLANRLVGYSLLATREIRGDGKGRHTTTHRELVPLPDGGVLVDTPGLRGVGLTGAGEGVERVFTDIEELAGECRFADCGHEQEPGCAVTAAVESGELAERRLTSYRKLLREVAWQHARTDARLRAERRREWKARGKAVRAAGVIRP
jgi:ribosome biogenesis GTPase